MKDKYLRYLSETKEEKLIPLMERYFNDEVSIEDVGIEAMKYGYLSYQRFRKEENLNTLLRD